MAMVPVGLILLIGVVLVLRPVAGWEREEEE